MPWRHQESKGSGLVLVLLVLVLGVFVFGAVHYFLPGLFTVEYSSSLFEVEALADSDMVLPPKSPVEVMKHLPTPEPLKAAYMTQCVSGTTDFRARLVKLVEETELNALMIDVKDFSGKLGFETDNPELAHAVSDECRSRDLKEFLQTLHDKGIYTIARVTVFQDPHYTKRVPHLAVQKASDGSTWTDRKGLSFMDVSAQPFWDYIVELSWEVYDLGFDEINYDYVRFPSDGNMNDIAFPETGVLDHPQALENFFAYLNTEMKQDREEHDRQPVLSADLFGMTMTNTDDLNIGQVLERALPHFDYIAPMVYPSHYPTGFNGHQNVNVVPYEIIKFSMDAGVRRTTATQTVVKTNTGRAIASTSPQLYTKKSYDKSKLRPWIQDFDYPVPYTSDMVRAQIQATYDAGLTSWMLWDPRNVYTRGALLPVENGVASISTSTEVSTSTEERD